MDYTKHKILSYRGIVHRSGQTYIDNKKESLGDHKTYLTGFHLCKSIGRAKKNTRRGDVILKVEYSDIVEWGTDRKSFVIVARKIKLAKTSYKKRIT